jgi:hypothetical protein
MSEAKPSVPEPTADDDDRPGNGPSGEDLLGEDLPELALPDFLPPGDAAVRRAVRRGVLRAGFAAAAWLLLAAVLAAFAWVGAGATRSHDFARVALRGLEAAHPEYEIKEGEYVNLGASTMELELRVRGEIDRPLRFTGEARQPVIGRPTIDIGEPSNTPIGWALDQGPASRADTLAYLGRLPTGVAASAVVEFTEAMDPAAFASFTGSAGPDPKAYGAVFLTPPYDTEQLRVTWGSAETLDVYARWAAELSPADDRFLDELDLPPAATLQRLARSPRISAVVVERASVPVLRALLKNPAVASVTIADVGFDVSAQLSR